MLIAFIDESYELGAGDIYLVSAVVCDGRSLADLEDGLDQVVESANRSYGTPWNAELHGYELYHGEGSWSPIHSMPRSRIGIYRDAVEAVSSSGANVFVSATTPSRLGSGDPHSICLRYLLERIDTFAERNDEHVIVICDDLHTWRQHRRSLNYYRMVSTEGWKPRKICRILDTMHFGDSAESRGLQAADLIAFLRHRLQRSGPSDPRAAKANKLIWSELDTSRLNLKYWAP